MRTNGNGFLIACAIALPVLIQQSSRDTVANLDHHETELAHHRRTGAEHLCVYRVDREPVRMVMVSSPAAGCRSRIVVDAAMRY